MRRAPTTWLGQGSLGEHLKDPALATQEAVDERDELGQAQEWLQADAP